MNYFGLHICGLGHFPCRKLYVGIGMWCWFNQWQIRLVQIIVREHFWIWFCTLFLIYFGQFTESLSSLFFENSVLAVLYFFMLQTLVGHWSSLGKLALNSFPGCSAKMAAFMWSRFFSFSALTKGLISYL